MSLRHIGTDVKLGEGTRIWHLTYIGDYTEIGTLTSVGSLTHIDHHVKIGDQCRIQGMVYIPPETIIEDHVFIGPGVVFTNDPYPPSGHLQGVKVESNAVICASAVIKSGVTIGKASVIGMGAVVTHDVEPETVVYGNPAKHHYSLQEYEKRRDQWIRDNDKRRS